MEEEEGTERKRMVGREGKELVQWTVKDGL